MARSTRHVRLYLNAATARLEEAAVLRERNYTMGAVYLAGYAVECVPKSLVLDCFPEHEQPGVVAQFRGAAAHDYGWLRQRYFSAGGSRPPADVARALALLDPWGTDLRYNPRTRYPGNAAVGLVCRWAQGRL